MNKAKIKKGLVTKQELDDIVVLIKSNKKAEREEGILLVEAIFKYVKKGFGDGV